MTKIIGVDIDEVLSETIEGLLKLNKHQINGIPMNKEDITDYYIFNIEKYKLTKKQAIELFRVYYDDAQKNLDLLTVKGAKEGLEKLKLNGWKIYLVTARKQEIKDFTIHWLNEHFEGLWDDILFANHFTENEISKSELCMQHGIEIMIEDNLDYAIELANAGIKMYLLDKPWNRKFDPEVNKGITKFYEWEDLKI